MTTAISIISDALAELGVVGAAETPSAEDAAFCLRKLNQVAQRLSNSRLAFPVLSEVSITLTGAPTYTVGPTGGTVTARPVKINHATAVDANGTEYVVDVVSREEWDSIGTKNVTGGPPDCIWYQAANTNGVVNVYPKASGYTLNLHCQQLLASFPNTATALTLPEGYESLLTLMLADAIAPAYGKQTGPDTRRQLAATMTGIRTTNAAPVYVEVGMGGEEFDIERGY